MTTAGGQTLVDVREGHRFEVSALERYLESRIPRFRGPVRVRQFLGGQSNLPEHRAPPVSAS